MVTANAPVTSAATPAAIPAPVETVESLGDKSFDAATAAQGLPTQEQVAGATDDRPRDPATGRFLPKEEAATQTPEASVTPAPIAPVTPPVEPVRLEQTPEWRKAQAAYDRQIAQLRAERDQERQQRENFTAQQALNAEIARGEAQLKADLIEREGLPAELAEKLVARQTALYRQEQAVAARDAQLLSHAKTQAAYIAAQKFGLPDATTLLNYNFNSPAELERAAQQLSAGVKESARVKALEAEVATLKQARVPNGTDPSQKLDNGVTMPGMGMSDQEKLRRAADGTLDLSIQETENILFKMGMSPLR